MSLTEQILPRIPGNPLDGLRKADRIWHSIKQDSVPIPNPIKTDKTLLGLVDWDVVVSGGTLGILIGAALAQRGWRVALIEKGLLRGRDQEWNISRHELAVLVELELLSEEELETAIATEYNPARVAFHQGPEIWVRDVLNIGVDPVYLLETLKQKFIAAGGCLLENTAFDGAVIHPDGVAIDVENGLKTRLLIDVMGHFSPIARQIRQAAKPDGICMVTGSCAAGFPHNDTGDLFVSFTPAQNHCQYFWEAFPAKDGRTTYLFSYLDAHPDRFSLEFFVEEYLRLLPEYQQVELDRIDFRRLLFGFFPSYRNSPLQSPWNRLLLVGDSSSSQSPLSFGGFGATIRHLKRLTNGICEALEADCLNRASLALLQPYQPNLSVTWLFQKTMSIEMGREFDPNTVNELLSAVFRAMSQLGDPVLRPFLQDVVQFPALAKALFKTSVNDPDIVAKVVPQVGILPLLDWMRHYINLGAYGLMSPFGQGIEEVVDNFPLAQKYYCHRWIDAWKYGSGGDYFDSHSTH